MRLHLYTSRRPQPPATLVYSEGPDVVPLKLFSMNEYAKIRPMETIPRYTVNVLSSLSLIIVSSLQPRLSLSLSILQPSPLLPFHLFFCLILLFNKHDTQTSLPVTQISRFLGRSTHPPFFRLFSAPASPRIWRSRPAGTAYRFRLARNVSSGNTPRPKVGEKFCGRNDGLVGGGLFGCVR